MWQIALICKKTPQRLLRTPYLSRAVRGQIALICKKTPQQTLRCLVFCILVLAHVHLSGDFGCEVLFLLLDALALCETDSVNELDGAA